MARSWLIRPHHGWADWDWTVEAEALHGLSRARIAAEGWPVETVLAELVAATQGRRIIADSLVDQYWLETLAQAADVATPFRIEHVATLFDEQGADEARIGAAVAHADGQGVARHRAAGDALWLAALVDHVTNGVQPMPALMAAQ